MSARDTIAIAGATGFVGHAVAARLAERFDVVGLTRGRRDATGAWSRLVTCDLFSLADVEVALAGARYVAYLVHSMLPSARLVQGSFADLDLICADNVGRAAAKNGVEQIVYLGGLMPPPSDRHVSAHLESRREVESALGAHGVPVTTLRAGMVVGPHGSSFEILTKLVARLPAMVLPAWSHNRCQPIDLDTVANLIDYCVGNPDTFDQTFDIGGPEILRYRDMIGIVGESLRGRPRPTFRVPFMSPRLSRAWVSLITGAPRSLVAPLVDSLRHDMIVRDQRLQLAANQPGLPFRVAVERALAATADAAAATASTDQVRPQAYRPAPRSPVTGVRSVQRLPLPAGASAEWAAHEYMRWLPRGGLPLVRVDVDDDRDCRFYLAGTHRRPLLELRFARDRSGSDRQLFYVVGGLLAKPSRRGRLEFRSTPAGDELLTAIHDFKPSLPWSIYRFTQALFHRWVMKRFGRHLARLRLSRPPGIQADAPGGESPLVARGSSAALMASTTAAAMLHNRFRSSVTCAVLLGLLACGRSNKPPACGDAKLLATPVDLSARGPWPVGVRTVALDGRPVEVWFPARRDTPGAAPRARYDLRQAMPATEAAKVPDADNAWLDCDCVRDLEVDVSHGPYPVVMFLHGAASFRMQSTFLTTHWASRGFVVIAPELPGVGLNAILGGEPTMFPALVPGIVLDAIVKPTGTDPFAFLRDRLDTRRVAVVGHSLGSVLARSVGTRPEITVKISLAGSTTGSNLSVGGETDNIAPPDRDPARLADAPPRSRSAVVRGAGHLAFTDLCLVGAERGGTLAIARAHGVAIPDMIATLALDGCRSTDAPFAVTAPAIRALTSGVLEESLFCDPQKARAIQALGKSPQIELVER